MGREMVDFFVKIPEIKIIPFSLVRGNCSEETFTIREMLFQ